MEGNLFAMKATLYVRRRDVVALNIPITRTESMPKQRPRSYGFGVDRWAVLDPLMPIVPGQKSGEGTES